MVTTNKLWIGILGMAVSGSVLANMAANDGGVYLVGGGGWFGAKNAAIGSAAADLTNNGTYNIPTQKRSNQTSYRVGVGTMVDPTLGVEAGYTWSDRKTTENLLTVGENITLRSSTGSFDVTGIGRANMGDALSAYMKLGAAYTEIKRTYVSTGLEVHPNINRNTRAFGPAGAIGLQYDLNNTVGFRVEAAGVAGKAANYGVTGNVLVRFG